VSPATSHTIANARCSAGDALAFDRDSGVSRHGSRTPLGVAEPQVADAQSGDEADAIVDRDGLAVVAREPRERARESRRVEYADFGAAVLEPLQSVETAATAQPVNQHLDGNAGARALGERGDELSARDVVVEDVHLEQDRLLRAADRVEPRRIILAGIDQQLDHRCVSRSAPDVREYAHTPRAPEILGRERRGRNGGMVGDEAS
jgi:hypothetical protein